MSKVLIVDGCSLYARAYHTRLNTLFSMLHKAKEDTDPDQLIMCFDDPDSTSEYRKSLWPSYKANRDEKPPHYYGLLRVLISYFRESRISTFLAPEADDLVYTIARQAASWNGNEVVIMSGDKDLFSAIDRRTSVLWWGRSFEARELVDEISCHAIIGVAPNLVPDYKSLSGDHSDNYPGCKGIGHVTALKLINEYGTIDDIYKNLDKIKSASIRKKLETDQELVKNVFLEIAKLQIVPNVAYTPDCCKSFGPDIIGPIVNQFMDHVNSLGLGIE